MKASAKLNRKSIYGLLMSFNYNIVSKSKSSIQGDVLSNPLANTSSSMRMNDSPMRIANHYHNEYENVEAEPYIQKIY